MDGKLFEFDIPIYNHPLTVVVGDREIALEFLRWKMNPVAFEDCKKQIEVSGGYALNADTGGGSVHGFIWVPDIDESYDVLVHETLHIGFFVLSHVGVPANHEAQEALCYLQGYLLEQVKARYKTAKPYVSKSRRARSSHSDDVVSESAMKVVSHSHTRAMVRR